MTPGAHQKDDLGRFARRPVSPAPTRSRIVAIDEAASQISLSPARALRFARAGGLKILSEGEPVMVCIGVGDTRVSMLSRVLDEAPEALDRDSAALFRERVACLDITVRVRYQPRVEQAAVELLRTEGIAISRENLHALLWGARDYLDRIIAQANAREDTAALVELRERRPPPPPGFHDLGIDAAAVQLGMATGRVRRLCRVGGLDVVSDRNEALTIRMHVDDRRTSLLENALVNPPRPFDRPSALDHRELIACLDRRKCHTVPKDIQDLAINLLRSEGRPLDRETLGTLLWAPTAQLDRIVRRANPAPVETITLASICESADVGRRCVKWLRELDVIVARPHAHRGPHHYEFERPPTRDELIGALMAMKPSGRGPDSWKKYAGVRFAFGLDALHDHPFGVLEDLADYLRVAGQTVHPSTMFRILKGNPEQLSDFVAGYNLRHGIEGYAGRRPARKADEMTLIDFVARLDPSLRKAPGTALDPTGDGCALPTEVDLRHLGSIGDDRLFQAGALITLYARSAARPPERRLHAALRASRKLEGMFDGDFDLMTVVGAVLSAWIETPGSTADYRPRMRTAVGWKHAVALFGAYVRTVPAAFRSTVLSFRIAPPAGSVGFYRRIGAEELRLKDDAKGDKADRLKDVLNDPQRLLDIMLQLRDRTRALRDHVLAKRDEVLQLGGTWPATGVMKEEFTDKATGTTVCQFVTYEIDRWHDLREQLIQTGAIRRSEFKEPSGNKVPPELAHLFEHEYVVTGYRCTGIDGSPTKPLGFVRQFEAGIFHPMRSGNEAEIAERLAQMEADGLSITDLHTPCGVWMFEGPKRRRLANLIQKHLGLVPIPIIEVDHGQQIAALALSTAYEWPTRPGEMAQHRLDDGKYRIFTEPRIDGRICTYKARRKYGERLGVLEEDFFMYERSIGLMRELLSTTTTRFYPGVGIPRLEGNAALRSKGAESGYFVYTGRYGVVTPTGIAKLVLMSLAGHAKITLKDGKDIWTAIARRAGLEVEKRQLASKHADPATTIAYGAETKDEVAALQTELAKMRAVVAGKGVRVAGGTDNVSRTTSTDPLDAMIATEEAVATVYIGSGQPEKAAAHLAEARRLRSVADRRKRAAT